MPVGFGPINLMPKTMVKAVAPNDVGRRRRVTAGSPTTKGPKKVDGYVGQKILDRRKELGFSQTDLGEKVGVTYQQMRKYEKGLNRVGASRLAAIAGALEVPVRYFFPNDDLEMPPATGDVGVHIAELERRLKVMHRELALLRRLQ